MVKFFIVASSYALISVVDSSSLVSVATYKKAHGKGFTKAIMFMMEACSSGGAVDPNFV